MLPVDVIFHGSVAGFTADTHFRHACVIGIRFGVEIFAETRVVASGTHGVPVHALTAPVGPFARVSGVFAKDIKPLFFSRVPRGFHGLESSVGAGNKELA